MRRRVAWAVVTAVLAGTALAGCGQDTYEYDETKIEASKPPAPARTMVQVREAAAASDAAPEAQMGADLPLPTGFPASVPMPSDPWGANIVVAHPGWFEVSVVLADPPGPIDQVLRAHLDDVYRAAEKDGVPVARRAAEDPATGDQVQVVDLEVDGRAVEISHVAGGTSLGYAVENVR